MGLAKAIMMEQEEQDWGTSYATFVCPKCGEESQTDVEIPYVQDHYTFELESAVTLDCSECGEEFPAEFCKDAKGCTILLTGHTETKVDFEPLYFNEDEYDDYHDWDEDPYFYANPAEPFSLFNEAYIRI